MSSNPTLPDMLAALGWRACSMTERAAGFRAWNTATNESAVVFFDNYYHLRDGTEYTTCEAAVAAAYHERFDGEPQPARSSPRRPMDHPDLTHDWTPYVIPGRVGFVHYDCLDCLTRSSGAPVLLCPDRVKAALDSKRDVAEYNGAMAEQAAICDALEEWAKQAEGDEEPEAARWIRMWIADCRGPDKYTRKSEPWAEMLAAAHTAGRVEMREEAAIMLENSAFAESFDKEIRAIRSLPDTRSNK